MRVPNEPPSALPPDAASGLGLSCQSTGVSLTGAPLLMRAVARFAARPRGEVGAPLKAASGHCGDVLARVRDEIDPPDRYAPYESLSPRQAGPIERS